MDFVIDTTFLINRWRQGRKGDEHRFIEAHPDSEIVMPWVVKAEFLRGAVLAGHPEEIISGFLDRYRVLWPDDRTLKLYASIFALLARSNRMIGPHDLWIAAAVLQIERPLLTRNTEEFARVPGILLERYKEGT